MFLRRKRAPEGGGERRGGRRPVSRGSRATALAVAVLALVAAMAVPGYAYTLPRPDRGRYLETVFPPAPPQGGDGIVVSKSSNRLYLFRDRRLVRRFDVATGSDPSYTPEGLFSVANKTDAPGDPVYGPRWLGLSVPNWADRRDPPNDPRSPAGHRYGIHGTDKPDSIGRYATAGCVRLRNEELVDLYEMVEVGTLVEIRR